MLKEAVVAYFKVRSRYLPEGTAQTQETRQSVQLMFRQRFEVTPP
jgi:hypothetical protein